MATTPNYDIDYSDKRFTKVESDKKAALSEIEKTYSGMVNQSDAYYQNMKDAAQDYADKQTEIQNEKTEFAIDEIEQQKAQAKKDYLKEQSGAYVDWQKQSNQYGANAEQMAASGLTNTGYSESAQVSMYNTYQNRVATARESYNLAVQNYNNAITEARLQNSSILAEIAFEALQKQLELSLDGFQYKNTLLLEKANKKMEADQVYWAKYQDVLRQINTENALAEDVRQYNESLAEQKRQADMANARQQEQIKIAQAELKLQQEKFAYEKSKASGSGGGSSIKKGSSGSSSKKSSGSSSSKDSGSSISKSGKKTTTKTSSKTVKSDTAKSKQTIDMQSVLNLGYGPISAGKLNSLVEKGMVKEYVDGTTVKFKKIIPQKR